jgi:FixJ family two-component response regulator
VGFPDQALRGNVADYMVEAIGSGHVACQLRIESLTDFSLISIVDDDEEVRTAIESLVMSLGLAARTYASAESFLRSPSLPETACIILDVQMPTMSGVELHRHLSELGLDIPIIFITAYPDKVDRALALNDGIICMLHKPFNEERLVEGIDEALKRRRGSTPAV